MPLKWIMSRSKPVAKAAFGVRWEEPGLNQIEFWSPFSASTWDAVLEAYLPSRHFLYSILAVAADFITYLKTHSVFSSQNCWYTKQQWLHNSWRPNTKILHSTNISKFQILVQPYELRNRDHTLSKLEFEWIWADYLLKVYLDWAMMRLNCRATACDQHSAGGYLD